MFTNDYEMKSVEHVSYNNILGISYIKENMYLEGEGHVVTFLAYCPF
jgi:hypothetical protein